MAAKKRLKPIHLLIFIIASAALLILATFLILHLSGFRYATYNTKEHGKIRYIGTVDGGNNPKSGRIYYSDGSNAKITSSTDKYTFKDGKALDIPLTYTLSYSNGDTYVGEIASMMRHGRGSLTFSGGDVFEGTFSYNEIDGSGTYYYLSGDVYVGGFSAGKKSGQGTYTWAPDSSGKSDIYEGSYSDDRRNGSGTYTWANGSVYTGTYVDDMKQGEGKLILASGDVYEGDFLKDTRTGEGTYTWASGESYVGQFLNNAITGYGTYYWTTGSNRQSYTGYFENGKIVIVDEEPPETAPGTGNDDSEPE